MILLLSSGIVAAAIVWGCRLIAGTIARFARGRPPVAHAAGVDHVRAGGRRRQHRSTRDPRLGAAGSNRPHAVARGIRPDRSGGGRGVPVWRRSHSSSPRAVDGGLAGMGADARRRIQAESRRGRRRARAIRRIGSWYRRGSTPWRAKSSTSTSVDTRSTCASRRRCRPWQKRRGRAAATRSQETGRAMDIMTRETI